MIKVSIARALKIKNRLAQRIGEVRTRIEAGTKSQAISKEAYTNIQLDNTKAHDILKFDWSLSELMARYEKLTIAMVDVKTKIHVANAEGGQTARTLKLAEAKGLLSLVSRIDCKVSEGWVRRGLETASTPERTYQVPQMNEKQQTQKKLETQVLIEDIQDEIDSFNASNRIDLDDSVMQMLSVEETSSD